jgi:hypothetical protein
MIKKYSLLYLCLTFFFILIPLNLFGINDFWDGVSVSYAFESKKNLALDDYMIQGGYFFQFIIYKLVFFISDYTNISYKYFVNLTYAVILFLLAIELRKFSITILKLDNFYSTLTGIILLLFPVWHILVSSIFISHILFVFFVFFSTRIFFLDSIYFKIIALIILIISFELKSNFLFSIILFFFYELRNFFKFKVVNFKNTIFIFFFNIVAYLFLINSFAPYGLWENHNQIINIFNLYNFKHLIWHSLQYMTFLIPFILINLILIFGSKKNGKFLLIKNITGEKLLLLITLLVMTLFSILPYLLVLKSSKFFFDYQFSPRYTLLLVCSISLLLSFNFQLYFNKSSYNKSLNINILVILFLLTLSSIYHFAHKYNYLQFRDHLIKQLKLINIEPGIVVLNGNNIPDPIMITKESNYVFWKSYGDSRWATHILKDRSIPKPDVNRFLKDNGNVVYLAENFEMRCLTTGEVLTDDYTGLSNVLSNLFNSNKNKLTINIKSKKCI